MDLGPTVTSIVTDETDWDASSEGDDSTRTIKLDASAFTANTHYPNGYLLSGICLAKNTSTGMYGPYVNAGANGTGTPLGFLFKRVKCTGSTARPAGVLKWEGVVKTSGLPTGHGMDASAKTALAPHFFFQ
jgi:hypothetical protein